MAAITVLIDPPASLKSPVWQHFAFQKKDGVIEKENTKCRLCDASVSYKAGNTTNMSTHLNRRHNITFESKKKEKHITSSGQLRIHEVLKMKSKYAPTSEKHKAITKSIGVFMAKDMRPYDIVENVGFKKMVDELDSRYRIPCRTHFADKVIPTLYEETKEMVTVKLQNARFVALTSDSWTSRATQSYNTITAHFIDEKWELNNLVLETTVMSESHTAENISNFLTRSISKWDLKKNEQLPSVTTDNASNVVNAAKLAQLTHVGCFAHTINLASQRGLRVPQMDRLLGRMRRVVSFLHRSTTAASVLRNKQVLLSLPTHKLINDVPTRWNSAYDMIEKYLEQQPAIEAVLLTKDIKKNAKDVHVLSDDDTTSAENAMKVLGPLKTITTVMSASKSPTLSMIHPLKEQMLRGLQPSESDSPLIRDVKAAVLKDLKPRYTDPEVLSILHESSCLDPRFKSMPYLSTEEKSAVFTSLTLKAIQLNKQIGPSLMQVKVEKPEETPVDPLLPATPPVEMTGPSTSATAPQASEITVKVEEPPQKKHKSALDDLFGDVFVTKVEPGQTIEYRVENEIVAYKSECAMPLNSNPLEWWKLHENTYPLLCSLAKKYLSIPATSVASERVFSTAGNIVTAQRSCLNPEQVDYLIFLKKNLVVNEDN